MAHVPGLTHGHTVVNRGDEARLYAKVAWRIIPLLFLCYVAAYLDSPRRQTTCRVI
jgi:hypothetical protein